MRIIFDGVETPRWRTLLTDLGVSAVAAGSDALKRGAGALNYEGEVWLNGGTVQDPVSDGCEAWALLAEQARPDRVVEYAGPDRLEHRGRYDQSTLVPVWLADEAFSDLREWAGQYGAIAVRRGTAARPEVRPVLRELASQRGVEVVILGAGLAELNDGEYDVALTTAWTIPQRFGDAVLLRGGRVQRVPRDQVGDVEQDLLQRAGVDSSWIGDGPARCRVAVASIVGIERENVLDTIPDVGIITHTTLRPRQRQTLPLIAENSANPRTLLVCDRCHLNSVCPEASPGSECAYEIPAKLETRDEIESMLQTLIGIQSQRAMLAVMAERLRGGEINPAVGTEIDRTFKLMERARNITERRDYTELTIRQNNASPQGGGAAGGFLEQLLGAGAAREIKSLDEPIDTSSAIEGVAR